MRYLLDQIQYNYNELKDKNEVAIIESYGYKAKRYTAMLTCKILITFFTSCKMNLITIKIK